MDPIFDDLWTGFGVHFGVKTRAKMTPKSVQHVDLERKGLPPALLSEGRFGCTSGVQVQVQVQVEIRDN